MWWEMTLPTPYILLLSAFCILPTPVGKIDHRASKKSVLLKHCVWYLLDASAFNLHDLLIYSVSDYAICEVVTFDLIFTSRLVKLNFAFV
jgi:hypothetical protein